MISLSKQKKRPALQIALQGFDLPKNQGLSQRAKTSSVQGLLILAGANEPFPAYLPI